MNNNNYTEPPFIHKHGLLTIALLLIIAIVFGHARKSTIRHKENYTPEKAIKSVSNAKKQNK